MSITVIGFFRTRSEAEEAVQQLTGAGFYRNDIDLSHSRIDTSDSSGYSDSDYQSVDSRTDEVRTDNDRIEARRTVDARTDYRDNPETVYQTNEEYINRDRSDSDNDASAHEYREKREHRGNAITRFFDSLFGDGSDDSKKYSNASARADSIVTVHAGSREQAEEAANILDGCGAMDIDEGELIEQTHRDTVVETSNAGSGYQNENDRIKNKSDFNDYRDTALSDRQYREEERFDDERNAEDETLSNRRFQPQGITNYNTDAALTQKRLREEEGINADRARRDAELKEMQLREEERINSEKERLEAEFKEKQLREQERIKNERERLETEFQEKQRREQERINEDRERLEAEFKEKQLRNEERINEEKEKWEAELREKELRDQERINEERERREAELEEKRLREEERINSDKRSEKIVISETVDLTNEGLTDEDLKEAGLSAEEIKAIRNAGDNDSYQTSGRETKIVYQEEIPAGQRPEVAGLQRRRSRIIDTRIDEDVRLREEHDRIHRQG